MAIFYVLFFYFGQLVNFGLAKNQYESSNQSYEARVLKTFEYMAPECEESGIDKSKADVYSLGVVLLELVTGRKSIDETNGQSFLRWVASHFISLAMSPRFCSNLELPDSQWCSILEKCCDSTVDQLPYQ